MKKKFVIKKPAKNRSTVQLVTHRYLDGASARAEGKERGTQTIYLGHFSLDLNPEMLTEVAAIPAGTQLAGITLSPGRVVDGQPFELHEQDIREIRDWLLEHGNHVRRERERERLDAERDAAAAVLRLQIEREVQLKFREALRADLLEELRPASAIPAINAAVEALAWAAKAVEIEAHALATDGKQVVTRRTKSMADATSEVAQLLQATQRLRREAFRDFEASCQAAGLMAAKPARRQSAGRD